MSLLAEMWSLMKNQCCNKKSKTDDKAQDGDLDSSAHSQSKEFEFSNDPNKPVGSDENFLVSDEN